MSQPAAKPAPSPVSARQRWGWTLGACGLIALVLLIDGSRAPDRQWLNRAAIWALHGYQTVGRPVSIKSGVTCRYRQSCSDYSLEMFQHHGFMPSLWYTTRRLTSCRPGVPPDSDYSVGRVSDAGSLSEVKQEGVHHGAE